MTRTRIGELVSVSGGGTPRRAEASYYGGGIPWVTPKDMKRHRIGESEVSITEAGVANSPAKLIEAGATLVVVRSGVLKHTLPVAITAVGVTVNQDMKALSPKRDRVDPEYLVRLVKAQEARILRSVRATTADNFPIDDLLSIEVPLPPLPEQRRIAGILDEADALCATARRAVETAKSAPAALAERLSDDTRPKVPLRGVVTSISSGRSIVGADESSAYRVLKISAVTSGDFIPSESKPLPIGYTPPPVHLAREGDLLVSRANTAELVGATAMVWESPVQPLALPDKLWKLQVNKELVDPVFVHSVISSKSFRAEVSRRATGSGGSMKNITQADYLAIPIPLPSPESQAAFADSVRQVRQTQTVLVERSAALDALFASLQHRAFRGEL